MVNDGLLLLLALMTLLLVMFVYAVIMLSPQDAVRTEPPVLNLPRRPLPRRPARGCRPPRPRLPRQASPVTPPAQPGTLMPLPVRAQRCPGAGSPARRRGNQRHSRHARNHRQLTPLAKPA
jgi:hypothetical protein